MEFSKTERQLARNSTDRKLKQNYERTERRLEAAAKRGDFKGMEKAMKQHHKYEYAMLLRKARRSRRRRTWR